MFISTETLRAYDLWLKAAEKDFKDRVKWVVAQVQRHIEKKIATIGEMTPRPVITTRFFISATTFLDK